MRSALPPALPSTLRVIERGWLSSNNILFFDADGEAALVDSGYASHAGETLALVDRALEGRRLARLYNTHGHSDHIGGNAALQARHACRVVIPEGLSPAVAEWDEDALLLRPAAQRGERFAHDATLAAGDEWEMGGLAWRALAVPGHDMHALAFHCADEKLLVSGDALWEKGFGIVFEALTGDAQAAFAATRATLDALARLPVDTVIPGHGAPFSGFDAALAEAYSRLDAFARDPDRFARHALKALLMFVLLERRRMSWQEASDMIAAAPLFAAVNARFFGLEPEALLRRIAAELAPAGLVADGNGLRLAG